MTYGIDTSLGIPVARVNHFEYQLSEVTSAPLSDVLVGVELHLRLNLRALLDQNKGTNGATHAIADNLAAVLLRDFDVKEKRDLYAEGWEDRDLAALVQILWRNAMPGYEPIGPGHPDWEAFIHDACLILHVDYEEGFKL